MSNNVEEEKEKVRIVTLSATGEELGVEVNPDPCKKGKARKMLHNAAIQQAIRRANAKETPDEDS